MTRDKKFIVIINTIMKVFFVFFEIFFGIYVYSLNQNINLVICYNIFKLASTILIVILLYKIVQKKYLIILYRLSFVFAFLSIFITLLISPETLFIIFIAQFFLALTEMLYYMPYEVSIMKKNSKTEIGNFLAIISALSLLVSTLSPFLSGLLIDITSYAILFVVLLFLSILCFVFSTKINFEDQQVDKVGLLFHFRQIATNRAFRFSLVSYSLYKISNDQIISIFLPLLIFLKIGTNLSVGIYSSLASLLAGIAVLISNKFFKNKSLNMWLNSLLQVCVSMLILFSSSLTIFFIYFFVKKITRAILQNGTNATVFSMLQGTNLENNLVEHYCAYNIVSASSMMLIFVVSLIVYNTLNNITSITILLALVSFLQIVSTIFLNISDKLLYQN